jgi:homoserine dehydrogenase
MNEVGVGIVGYGTVGRGTAEAIVQNAAEIEARTGARLRVAAVCRRSPLTNGAVPPGARAVTDWRELLATPGVDVVVETMGGVTAAHELVRAALEAGKPVVTANKNLIAEHGGEIFALARRQNLPIGIEASVAGAVPIVRALAEAVSGDRILVLRGILNGTTNYILTRMSNDGLTFEEALLLAQQAGYAEADPTFDIEGIDARDKLCILARLAFRCEIAPSQIAATGIRHISAVDFHYARRLHSTIRLLAVAEKRGSDLEISVRPWMLHRRSILSSVEGAHNAVVLEGERTGTHMLYGRGAGSGPTGIAVLSDLMQIAADIAAHKLAFRQAIAAPCNGTVNISGRRASAPWYLRLTVHDRPGIVAHVAQALARNSANIDAVFQEPGMQKHRLSFVVTVEPVSECAIQQAVSEINAADFMLEAVLVLPILEDSDSTM